MVDGYCYLLGRSILIAPCYYQLLPTCTGTALVLKESNPWPY